MESQGPRKVLLVTIATLGCGKSTVGNALNTLYGARMGHIQNDQIPQSKTKKLKFIEGTKTLLAHHDIVFMDRNNAEKREREQVFRELASEHHNKNTLFVAVNFLPSGPNRHARRVTRRLVHDRSNHLTIRDMPESKVKMIIASCEKRFQLLDVNTEPDSGFDSVINLSAGESLKNIKTVVAALQSLGIPGQFSEEQITAAYNAALKYEPKLLDLPEPPLPEPRLARPAETPSSPA